ncbi:hypothetical protein EMCRGX_G019616 [Ephydatia muelleri]
MATACSEEEKESSEVGRREVSTGGREKSSLFRSLSKVLHRKSTDSSLTAVAPSSSPLPRSGLSSPSLTTVLKDPAVASSQGAVASSQGASFAETTQRLALSEASGGRSLTPPLSRPGVYRPVPVNQFQEYVAVRDEKRQLLFKEEFELIQKKSPWHPSEGSLNPLNESKNRYGNITAFDHTRVKLTPIDGIPCSDYIHANFIAGYTKEVEYIAAQGPLESTVCDFWRMVWEHDVHIIAMVTNVVEQGKSKCAVYWPSRGSSTYGDVEVTVEKMLQFPDYTARTFCVKSYGGPPRTVLQFHHTDWTDNGTPLVAAPILYFLEVIHTAQAKMPGPLLIHCSAGVGRTGTLIALDYCLKQMKAEGTVDVRGVMQLLRDQRNYLVQTEQQFVFLHYALLEAIVFGRTMYTLDEFCDKYPALKAASHQPLMMEYGKIGVVKAKGRKSLFIKKVMPRAQGEEEEDEEEEERGVVSAYPAHYIGGYHSSETFIIAEGPLGGNDSPFPQFWQMVIEQKCAHIVTLSDAAPDGGVYWPQLKQTFVRDDISLATVEERCEGVYTMRKIALTSKSGAKHTVTQHHYNRYSEDSSVDFVGFVCKVVRETDRSTGTIAVHSPVTQGPSGMFCALWCCIKRLQLEKVVDVFHVARKLQLQKPNILESAQQYLFLYDCVYQFVFCCHSELTQSSYTCVLWYYYGLSCIQQVLSDDRRMGRFLCLKVLLSE